METKEINELMIELIESGIDKDSKEFNKRGLEIVNKISDHAEKTKIWELEHEKGEIFDGSTSRQVYGYMLDRIVNAPTVMHRNASVLLIMPFVRMKLKEEGKL